MSRFEGMSIKAAAIYHDGMTYFMEAPKRHHDIIAGLDKVGLAYVAHQGEQGFVTSDGTFVRRKPALRIADAAGQIIRGPTAPTHGLFSEDIF